MGMLPLRVTLVVASALYIVSYNQADARDDGSINAQFDWNSPDSHVVDMLTGSLKYSWMAPANQPSSQRRGSPAARVRIENLQSVFDSSVISGPLMASDSDPKTDGKKSDCMAYLDVAVDTSIEVLNAMSEAINNNQDIAQVLSPLSKAIIVPSHEDTQSAVANAMRSLEMGLIGFHHVMQSFSQEVIEAYFTDVVFQAQLLRQQARDVVDCVDNAAYFELASSISRPSCRVVQILYDDYHAQAAAKIEAQIAKDDFNKPLLESLLASLQFQSAGAYLTHQGAQDVVEQLEKSSSSEEVSSLLQSVNLAIGAGDALQACQSSVQKSAIQQESSSISVSDFEQMIYSHLGMNMKNMDPTLRVDTVRAMAVSDDGIYGGCQKLLDEAISTARTVQDNLGSEGSPRIADTVLSRYVEMMEERLRNSLDGRPEIELRQLEFALGVLVRTIRVLPPWRTYASAKESLGLIQQLESGVHKLYGCVLSKTPPRNPEGHANGETSKDRTKSKSDTIQCDIMTKSFRDSLSVFLNQVSSVKKEGVGEDKEVVETLQTNIQELAESLEEMEKAQGLGNELQDSHSRQATLQTIYTQSQSAHSKAIGELSEFIPFMIVQANSLEACSNVRRITNDRRAAEEDGDEEDKDDVIEIEDIVEEDLLN
ncbi:hypothetical protein BGZ76_003947 [Entomortierella beljakovae]|nr:hypothetical protein BGZ76_003947 [Entomortierella beljakovae]